MVMRVAEVPGRGPLSLRLRRETGDLHHALETGLGLLDADLDVERYAEILHAFLDVYGAMEAHPAYRSAWRRLGLDPAPRRKLAWLRRDLSRLPAAPGGRPGEEVPLRLESWPEGLGAAYVTEGSTLGGRTLVRTFARRTAVGAPALPTLFFEGYGRRTGPRWTEFTGALDALSLTRGEADGAIAGARHLFALLAERAGVGPPGATRPGPP